MPFDPRFLEFPHFANLTGQLLARYGYVPHRVEEKQWRYWANAVRQIPAITPFQVPDPQLYTDWQSWAYRLSEALYNLGL